MAQKFLVCMPCYDRVFDSTIKNVLSQQVPDHIQLDIFMPYIGYDTSSSHQNITDKYNQARDIVLSEGYAGMWCVESDMCVTPDALCKLLSAVHTSGYDVVYGLYVFRRPPYGLNDYITLSTDDSEPMHGYPLSSVLPGVFAERLADGAVQSCEGVGLGNTLVMRKALEATPFVLDWSRPHARDTEHEHYSHCDWYTAIEWQKRGIRQAVHYGVRTGHHTMIGGQACTLWPAKAGIVPQTHFRALPYGGFDLTPETKKAQNWIDDDRIVARYQECLCTPTDMQYNLAWLSYVAHGNVVELGTRFGVSTTAFMVSNRVDKLVTIDNDSGASYAAQFFKHDPRFTQIIADSTDPHTLVTVQQAGIDSIDLLFIDTLHTTSQVLQELELWWPMVRHDGLVVFHDGQIEDVYNAIVLWYYEKAPKEAECFWFACGRPPNNPYPIVVMRKCTDKQEL